MDLVGIREGVDILLRCEKALLEAAYLGDIFKADFLADMPCALYSFDLFEGRLHLHEELTSVGGLLVALQGVEEEAVEIGLNDCMEYLLHGTDSSLEEFGDEVDEVGVSIDEGLEFAHAYVLEGIHGLIVLIALEWLRCEL